MAGDALYAAIAAYVVARTPARVNSLLAAGGEAGVIDALGRLGCDERDSVGATADALREAGAGAVLLGEPGYPRRLAALRRPPGVLFYLGDPSLMDMPSVGMCGSRNVSEAGLQAARTCGDEVARRGLGIVSGYAKGVDMATHLSALESGGRTVVVLAEGLARFRVKREMREHFDPARVTVVSQFPPSQGWNVGAAMTRNAVIAGLSKALVVIEAGAKGGTLDAGRQALRMPRPVLALEFSTVETPAGNRQLIAEGAQAVRSAPELGRLLDRITDEPTSGEQQRLL